MGSYRWWRDYWRNNEQTVYPCTPTPSSTSLNPPMQIRLATPPDFPTIAAFIEEHNQTPSSQCIQSSTDEGVESLLAEMQTLHASGEMVFFLGQDDNQILGVMGCEFEIGSGRGWVRGPIIATHPRANPVPDADFPTLRRGLYHALDDGAPAREQGLGKRSEVVLQQEVVGEVRLPEDHARRQDEAAAFEGVMPAGDEVHLA
ncbi:MAG: hypothetical protein HC806_01085, partial [Anaerolineae bacterium]|nr:hypothetical protein [Anaerolineae bacterium]